MHFALNPVGFLNRALVLGEDRIALIEGEHRLTYRQFAERVSRLAHLLRALGVEPGDRVAVISPNTRQMLESFYGVPMAGAVLSPLNYRLRSSDFAYILAHSGAKILLLDGEYLDAVASIRDQLPALREILVWNAPPAGLPFGLDYEVSLANASAAAPEPLEVDENAMMTLNYTSGTTAHPKGVMLTYRNCYLAAVDFAFHLRLTREDQHLWTLPMFHANGWGAVWAVTGVGGTHVLLRRVDPELTWTLIDRHRVTIAAMAPTVLIMLLGSPLASSVSIAGGMRIVTGGASPPPSVVERMERLGIDIIHGYGLTETSPFISVSEWRREWDAEPAGERARRKSRQGVALLCSGELKVVRPDLEEVRHDGEEVGEVVARGNVVMAGYYRDPEATEKAFRGGWFHTGDLAVVDAEGYMRVVDREKDMIISGGENISSLEVETVLHRHPDVTEAAVVAAPHDKWGEIPVAFLVLRPGTEVAEDEVIEFCRQNMARMKAPRGVFVVEQLPKTATGKIQKFLLRQMARDGSSPPRSL